MLCNLCEEEGVERGDLRAVQVLCDKHYSVLHKLETSNDDYFRIRSRVKKQQLESGIYGQFEKNRTRYATRIAIGLGVILPTPCEVCGENHVDTHHNNYADPFDVNFLCRKHHREHHRDLVKST